MTEIWPGNTVEGLPSYSGYLGRAKYVYREKNKVGEDDLKGISRTTIFNTNSTLAFLHYNTGTASLETLSKHKQSWDVVVKKNGGQIRQDTSEKFCLLRPIGE